MEGIVELHRYKLEQIPEVASDLLTKFGDQRVWLFDAPMGAGKTTLIKELCRQLGVEEETSSPTFAIVNVYPTTEGEEVYHIDCYRLESEADAYRIGAEEYLESGNWCFVEWPALLGGILPEEALWLRIDPVSDGEARILSSLQGVVTPKYDVER